MGKVYIFIGKGGVGKSTCSSLEALRHSEQSGKTKLVSMDPAHNLHDIFLTPIKGKNRKIIKNLYAEEADLEKISHTYMDNLKREMAGIYHYQQGLNLDKYYNILKFAPGMEEYAAWLAMESCFMDNSYENIVLDTPPTALTIRTLALCSVNLHWIEQLEAMRKEIVHKKNTVARIRKENRDVLERDPVFSRLQKMKSRYDFIQSCLRNDQLTEIVLVLNEDELSFAESKSIRDDLKDLAIPLGRIIINKSGGEGNWIKHISMEFPLVPIEIVPASVHPLTGIDRLQDHLGHMGRHQTFSPPLTGQRAK